MKLRMMIVVGMLFAMVSLAHGEDSEKLRTLDAARIKAATQAADQIQAAFKKEGGGMSGLKRVAVVGLVDDDEKKSMADYLTIKLTGGPLTVLARSDIQKVLDELAFTVGREDVFDPETIKKLGRILAADGIIFGSVRESTYEPEKGRATVRLNLKLANVERASFAWADAIGAEAVSADFIDEQEKLAEERRKEEERRLKNAEQDKKKQQERMEAARQQKEKDAAAHSAALAKAEQERKDEEAKQARLADEARRTQQMQKIISVLAGVAIVALLLAVIAVIIRRIRRQARFVADSQKKPDEWQAVTQRLNRDSAVRGEITTKLRGAIQKLREAESAAHGSQKADLAMQIGQAVGSVTSLASEIQNAPVGDPFSVDKTKMAGGTLDKIVAFDTVFDELAKSVVSSAEAVGVAVNTGGDVASRLTQLKSLVSQLQAKYAERNTYIRGLN
jgi:hypothetical protein